MSELGQTVRGTGGYGVSRRRTRYSGLMFAARITLPHFSVSSARSLAKSEDEPVNISLPNSAIRAFTVGSSEGLPIDPMISAGALRHANTKPADHLVARDNIADHWTVRQHPAALSPSLQARATHPTDARNDVPTELNIACTNREH